MLNTEKIGFECVLPLEIHAQLIMGWRNDSDTLRMSYHTLPKVWESFWDEFRQDYFVYPDLPPLFALYEGQRIAFLRFYPVAHPQHLPRRCCEVSINLAPECRGKGLGVLCLKAVNEWLMARQYDDVYAEVKQENQISQKTFEKAGYEKLENALKFIQDTGEFVPICRYLISLTPKKDESKRRVFVVAEAGSNWRMGTPKRDWEMAKALVDVAVEAEADAVKFQVYRPETIYVQNAGASDYLASSGIQEDIRAIFSDLSMPYEMIPRLAEYCQKQGLHFMATPFSKNDFLAVDPYVSVHKIASYEISHLRLIELAARSGKPLILSTGAANEEDIDWAVKTYRANGGKALTLLQCTARYPAEANSMNLNAIPWLKQRFKVSVGLSDHSRHPLYAPVAAVALGAEVIEKHYTLSNLLPGPDHSFALTPSELKEMVQAIRRTEPMLGEEIKTVHESEQELRAFARRGIQALRDIKEGEVFEEGVNIEILRPGKQLQGIHPRFLSELKGKAAKRRISAGTGIQTEDWK